MSSIEKIVKVHFQKEQETKLDIIPICSRIISGLKVDEHVCIRSFNWGTKGNLLEFEETSGTKISFYAKLKFLFMDNEEESRIMDELRHYLKKLTPKEVKFSVF